MVNLLPTQRTYKNIPEFNLYRPTCVEEVCEILHKFGNDCVLMGGGIDLLQDLKSGLQVENLIYLKNIPELNLIKMVDDTIRVGACVTHQSFENDPIINGLLPSLAGVWSEIGNIRVRVVGTIGGNILRNDPNYDGTPALAALNSIAHFRDKNGLHRIPVIELNQKKPPGFLTTIEIPIGNSLAFTMDRTLKPVASVALSASIQKDSIQEIHVSIGCAFSTPLEKRLNENIIISSGKLREQVTELARVFSAELPNPLDNVFASASYRRRMICVSLSRQLLTLATGNR